MSSTYSLVKVIPNFGGSGIESNFECERRNKDGGNEDRVLLDKSVVESASQGHFCRGDDAREWLQNKRQANIYTWELWWRKQISAMAGSKKSIGIFPWPRWTPTPHIFLQLSIIPYTQLLFPAVFFHFTLLYFINSRHCNTYTIIIVPGLPSIYYYDYRHIHSTTEQRLYTRLHSTLELPIIVQPTITR